MAKAILFDIDGTLLHTQGLGGKAMRESILSVCCKDIDVYQISWAGETDSNVLMQLLKREGFTDDETGEMLPHIFSDYIKRFTEYSRANREKYLVFPGVRELLESVRGQTVGLVTGNILTTSYIKLDIAGLYGFFPYAIGGFGDDHYDRNKLVPIALERMTEHYKVGGFEEVWVIGDSPKDYAAAHSNGAKSLLVATGVFSYEELGKLTPDALVRDFSETESILDILFD